MSNSSCVGWREPSAAANVPAPQGDPASLDSQFASHQLLVSDANLTSVDFTEIADQGEGVGVPQWYVDDAVVCKSAERRDGRGFLSTTRGARRHEHACIFAC